jgi:voltage-gated potassium channel
MDVPDPSELRPGELTRRQRLVAVYLAGLAAVVLSFTALYGYGMAALEGRPRSPFQALNTVIETLTTTGFGADSPWETPAMNLLVATMQVSGVVIGFVTLRVLVIPLFERTPLNLDDRLTPKDDHLVLAEYDRDSDVLLDELEALDVDYVLVESDDEEAMRLSDDGYQAINGDPESPADLRRASVADARMLVTDAGERTASVVLTALEANPELRVVSFTHGTRRQAALAEIGVDRAVAPGALIGTRLAAKATTGVDAGVADDAVAIREVVVRRDGALHGRRLDETPLWTTPSLTVVAAWFDGDFRSGPDPATRLPPNAVLVVAGPAADIEAAAAAAARVRSVRSLAPERVLVGGLGDGGAAAVDALGDGVDVTTVDQDPDAGADVVGDLTEPETLAAADVDDASALVVTVGDDATALLAVAMARSVAPELEVLVRVTDAEKAGPAVRAGADYVLSVQRVSARLVAGEAYGERVMDPVSQVRLVRTGGGPFAGRTLAAARDAAEGWSVVGVVADGDVVTAPDAEIGADDEVVVAGDDDAIAAFERRVGST